MFLSFSTAVSLFLPSCSGNNTQQHVHTDVRQSKVKRHYCPGKSVWNVSCLSFLVIRKHIMLECGNTGIHWNDNLHTIQIPWLFGSLNERSRPYRSPWAKPPRNGFKFIAHVQTYYNEKGVMWSCSRECIQNYLLTIFVTIKRNVADVNERDSARILGGLVQCEW